MDLLAFSFLGLEGDGAVTFLLLGSLSAALVSMGKTGFGGSIGMLAVPILIYACGRDSVQAIGLMLPLLIFCDLVGLFLWWRKWDSRIVAILLPGAVIGASLGGLVLWLIQRAKPSGQWTGSEVAGAWLNLIIGSIALGFVILGIIRALRSKPMTFKPVFWQGTIFGGLASLTSTIAHAGGPITTMYFLPQRLTKDRYVASSVLYYAVGNQLKILPYFFLGMLNRNVLAASVPLLPAVIAGALLGVFLHKRIGQANFNVIVYFLLALAGVDLVTKAGGVLWFQ